MTVFSACVNLGMLLGEATGAPEFQNKKDVGKWLEPKQSDLFILLFSFMSITPTFWIGIVGVYLVGDYKVKA